jgi:hypothetical protein
MGKIYTKNVWVDEVLASTPAEYKLSDETESFLEENVRIELTTALTTSGTPVTAIRMNNIEEGIDALDTLVDEMNQETVYLQVVTDEVEVADGVMYFTVPPELDGKEIISADACVYVASSDGSSTFTIYNITQAHEILSTAITLGEGDYNTFSSGSGVINTSNDELSVGDRIRIDVDSVGADLEGLDIVLVVK